MVAKGGVALIQKDTNYADSVPSGKSSTECVLISPNLFIFHLFTIQHAASITCSFSRSLKSGECTTLQNMPELDNILHPRKHVSHIGCRYEML